MSPASYRAAPPRVVAPSLTGRHRVEQTRTRPWSGRELLAQGVRQPGRPLGDLSRAALDGPAAPTARLAERPAPGGEQGEVERGPAVPCLCRDLPPERGLRVPALAGEQQTEV